MKTVKVLALIASMVAALGMFASTASAVWMENLTDLAAASNVAPNPTTDESFTLKAAGTTITCTAIKIKEGEIIPTDKLSAKRLEFLNCTANENCTVTKSLGTVPVTGVVVLEGNTAAKASVTPTAGTLFATIKFDGAECALLGTQPVTGKATLLAPTLQDERTLQLVEAKVSGLSAELKVGSSAAELKGSALIELSSNNEWSFL